MPHVFMPFAAQDYDELAELSEKWRNDLLRERAEGWCAGKLVKPGQLPWYKVIFALTFTK